ncbi:hypothetical protein GIB67_039472, partial [Kingdonia uniflora]
RLTSVVQNQSNIEERERKNLGECFSWRQQQESFSLIVVEDPIKAEQHFLKQNDTGSWIQDSALMLSMSKEVPWFLDDGTARVHVVGARGATGMVLTLASEVFEESGRSLVRGTLDYLQGLKMLGVKRIERVLPTGTFLTVVGQRFTMGKASGRKAAKKPTQNERLMCLEDVYSLMVNKMDAMMALILTLSTKNPNVDGEGREGVRNSMENAIRGRGRGLPMGEFMRDSRNAGINPTISTPLCVVGRGKETISPQIRTENFDSDNEQCGTQLSNTFDGLEIDVGSVDKFADFRENEGFVEIEGNRAGEHR